MDCFIVYRELKLFYFKQEYVPLKVFICKKNFFLNIYCIPLRMDHISTIEVEKVGENFFFKWFKHGEDANDTKRF